MSAIYVIYICSLLAIEPVSIVICKSMSASNIPELVECKNDRLSSSLPGVRSLKVHWLPCELAQPTVSVSGWKHRKLNHETSKHKIPRRQPTEIPGLSKREVPHAVEFESRYPNGEITRLWGEVQTNLCMMVWEKREMLRYRTNAGTWRIRWECS